MMPPRKIDSEDYLDEITVTLRRIEITLDMMEQSLGVLVWQGMPWWRRLAAHWRHASDMIEQTEQEYDEAGTEWNRAMKEKSAADQIGHDEDEGDWECPVCGDDSLAHMRGETGHRKYNIEPQPMKYD